MCHLATIYCSSFPSYEIRVFLCFFFFFIILVYWSRGIVAVGIAIRQRARRSGFRVLAGARDISLFRAFQTGSGVHPASYSIDTLILFPGKSGRTLMFTIHVYVSEVTNERSSSSTAPICLHGVEGGKYHIFTIFWGLG